MRPPPDWQPWHKQAGESDLGFSLFQSYLTLAPLRDVRRLARPGGAMQREELARLAREWEWRERARLWDAHLAKLYTSTIERHTEETARDVAERQLRLTAAMQELAGLEIEALLRMQKEAGGSPGVITPRDAFRMVVGGVRLERLIRGETTEKIETGPDLSGFNAEDLRKLRELQERAGVR